MGVGGGSVRVTIVGDCIRQSQEGWESRDDGSSVCTMYHRRCGSVSLSPRMCEWVSVFMGNGGWTTELGRPWRTWMMGDADAAIDNDDDDDDAGHGNMEQRPTTVLDLLLFYFTSKDDVQHHRGSKEFR